MSKPKFTPEELRAKRCVEALKSVARPHTVPKLIEAAQIFRNRHLYGTQEEVRAALMCLWEALGAVEEKNES